MTGVVRHQVVTDERDERIGAAERNAFQRVGQGNADYGADTDNGLQSKGRCMDIRLRQAQPEWIFA